VYHLTGFSSFSKLDDILDNQEDRLDAIVAWGETQRCRYRGPLERRCRVDEYHQCHHGEIFQKDGILLFKVRIPFLGKNDQKREEMSKDIVMRPVRFWRSPSFLGRRTHCEDEIGDGEALILH